MKIEVGKTYLTKGWYVVEIIAKNENIFFASQRTSPGKCNGGYKDIYEYCADERVDWGKKYGWSYTDNGLTYRSQDIDCANDLEIVAELPFALKDPPEGYTWRSGFPKVQIIEEGPYLTNSDNLNEFISGYTVFVNDPLLGIRRIALEKITIANQSITTPSPQLPPPTLPSGYVFVFGGIGLPLYKKPSDGDWFVKYNYVTKEYGKIVQAKGFTVPAGSEERRYIVKPVRYDVVLPQKEEKMKKSTLANAVKSVGSAVFNAANYTYFEPAVTVTRLVKNSLRYIVFFGTIAGAIYGANDPAALKKNVLAFMPKVTIEMPDAMK